MFFLEQPFLAKTANLQMLKWKQMKSSLTFQLSNLNTTVDTRQANTAELYHRCLIANSPKLGTQDVKGTLENNFQWALILDFSLIQIASKILDKHAVIVCWQTQSASKCVADNVK